VTWKTSGNRIHRQGTDFLLFKKTNPEAEQFCATSEVHSIVAWVVQPHVEVACNHDHRLAIPPVSDAKPPTDF